MLQQIFAKQLVGTTYTGMAGTLLTAYTKYKTVYHAMLSSLAGKKGER